MAASYQPLTASAEPVQITRWQGAQHPNLTTIRERLLREHLTPYRWTNGPHFRHAARSYRTGKVLYCVQGDLTISFPDSGQEVRLYAGDRLEVAAGVRYAQIVGPAGVECLECDRAR